MTGILLTNLGTPDAPTPSAIRRYLREFLSDPRVVEIPRAIWLPILYGAILPLRPFDAAKRYQSIWTKEGSPLLHIAQQQKEKLQALLPSVKVALGMRYGNPSIQEALETLKTVDRLLVLPLYPQYCAATTASTFDAVSHALSQWRVIPEVRFITHYHDKPLYIHALAHHIQQHKRSQKLLFSFHGIPQRSIDQGDPYATQCHQTAQLVADALQLSADQWSVVFQSRFGRAKWLQPYCSETLKNLAKSGCTEVDVICPGFSADCLETLEEISIENRNLFFAAGGKQLNYIPALNDSPLHMEALQSLILKNLQGWG